MKPVLLVIMDFNEEEGKGILNATYVGIMSHKHIYARHFSGNTVTFPKYIRVKRSYAASTGVRCFLSKEPEICAVLKELKCSNGITNFMKIDTVCFLGNFEPIISEIDKIWNFASKFANH